MKTPAWNTGTLDPEGLLCARGLNYRSESALGIACDSASQSFSDPRDRTHRHSRSLSREEQARRRQRRKMRQILHDILIPAAVGGEPPTSRPRRLLTHFVSVESTNKNQRHKRKA